MNQLQRILKAANISTAELSQAMDMPVRTLTYHFSTGRIPFALIYKLHLVTGLSIEDLVPKFLAENWLYLMEEQTKLNKPRGKQKSWAPPKEGSKKVSRETLLQTVAPPAPAPVASPAQEEPKITKKKPSRIADLMRSSPPPPSPSEEEAPDFSNVPDEVFNTSQDQNPLRKKR